MANKTPPPFLTLTEMKRLLAAIKSKRDYALFLIAYRHGLRASEIGLLQVDGVDLKGFFVIPHQPAVAGDIGTEDRHQLAFHARSSACSLPGLVEPEGGGGPAGLVLHGRLQSVHHILHGFDGNFEPILHGRVVRGELAHEATIL